MFYIALLFCQMHFVFYFGSLFVHLTYEGEPYYSNLILTCVLKLLFIQWIYCTDLFFQMFWVNSSSDNFLFFHVQNSNVKFMRDCIERPWCRVLVEISNKNFYTNIFIFIICVTMQPRSFINNSPLLSWKYDMNLSGVSIKDWM